MQKRFIQRSLGEVGLSPIVIVIIIALVLGGFLVYQKYPLHQGSAGQAQQAPTPTDETTNFKTYTNPELGYSFDYPADWEFTDRTDEDVASNQLQNAYLNYSGNSNLQDNEVSINVLKLPEHIIQRVKGGGGFGDAGMASEDIDTKIDNVNGKEVIKVHRKYSSLVNENEWKNTGENYLIYIPLREGTYLILSSNIKTKDAVDKIFSTFKFLDQNQVDQEKFKISNGSTYDCGDIPDAAFPNYEHFDVRNGPEWSPACSYVAWSMWKSGTSCPDCPEATLDSRQGVFLYNNSDKSVKKIYEPKELGLTPEFIGWINKNEFVYKVNDKEYKYSILTNNSSPITL